LGQFIPIIAIFPEPPGRPVFHFLVDVWYGGAHSAAVIPVIMFLGGFPHYTFFWSLLIARLTRIHGDMWILANSHHVFLGNQLVSQESTYSTEHSFHSVLLSVVKLSE
jgi:hypothetical protein